MRKHSKEYFKGIPQHFRIWQLAEHSVINIQMFVSSFLRVDFIVLKPNAAKILGTISQLFFHFSSNLSDTTHINHDFDYRWEPLQVDKTKSKSIQTQVEMYKCVAMLEWDGYSQNSILYSGVRWSTIHLCMILWRLEISGHRRVRKYIHPLSELKVKFRTPNTRTQSTT